MVGLLQGACPFEVWAWLLDIVGRLVSATANKKFCHDLLVAQKDHREACTWLHMWKHIYLHLFPSSHKSSSEECTCSYTLKWSFH